MNWETKTVKYPGYLHLCVYLEIFTLSLLDAVLLAIQPVQFVKKWDAKPHLLWSNSLIVVDKLSSCNQQRRHLLVI